jgi:hypothetical protein
VKSHCLIEVSLFLGIADKISRQKQDSLFEKGTAQIQRIIYILPELIKREIIRAVNQACRRYYYFL